MEGSGSFRRRHLPHWDMENKPVFITACLDGSIPAAGLRAIHSYRDELDRRGRPQGMSVVEWEYRKHKLVFAMVDDLLDHRSPVRHLEDPQQAAIVQDAFLHFAGERYTLFAFVVMPSHHHWLFLPDEQWSLNAVMRSRELGGRKRTAREIISHSIQSYTATMCNRVRGARGPYWQSETFDHFARSEAEVSRIIHYIERNPVAAGLVTRPEDWPWSSARIRARAGIKLGDPILKLE